MIYVVTCLFQHYHAVVATIYYRSCFLSDRHAGQKRSAASAGATAGATTTTVAAAAAAAETAATETAEANYHHCCRPSSRHGKDQLKQDLVALFKLYV